MARTSAPGALRRDIDRVEGHAHRVRAATTLRASAPRDIDEHAPHHPGRDAEKVLSVLPVDRIPSEQAEAQLVDQRRGLKTDVGALANQATGRHAVELVVDKGHHAIEGVFVPLAPGAKQRRHLAAIRNSWQSAHAGDRGQSSRGNERACHHHERSHS